MAERNKPRSLPDKLTEIPNPMSELLKNDIDCPMKIIVEKHITTMRKIIHCNTNTNA